MKKLFYRCISAPEYYIRFGLLYVALSLRLIKPDTYFPYSFEMYKGLKLSLLGTEFNLLYSINLTSKKLEFGKPVEFYGINRRYLSSDGKSLL